MTDNVIQMPSTEDPMAELQALASQVEQEITIRYSLRGGPGQALAARARSLVESKAITESDLERILPGLSEAAFHLDEDE